MICLEPEDSRITLLRIRALSGDHSCDWIGEVWFVPDSPKHALAVFQRSDVVGALFSTPFQTKTPKTFPPAAVTAY